ncbi:MAG: glycosyltransferase, partial [Polaribacter sp.]
MDISVVIPLLNEEESLQELHDWIAKVMQSNRYLYEIIFIDDDSEDDSVEIIKKVLNTIPIKIGITRTNIS